MPRGSGWVNWTASSTDTGTATTRDEAPEIRSGTRVTIPNHAVCKRCKRDCKRTFLAPPLDYINDRDFCEDFLPVKEEEEVKNEWWDD